MRSVLWQKDHMRDLGTLGGPDAVMQTLNARGQIRGASYTNATPNPGYRVAPKVEGGCHGQDGGHGDDRSAGG